MAGGSHFLTGHEAMVRNLTIHAARVSRSARSALLAEGKAIIKDAQDNYVPKDTEELSDSGTARLVTSPTEFAGVMQHEVELSFGGGDIEYAIPVHEHPSGFSPPSWRGIRNKKGQFRPVQFSPPGHGPKYLERPLFQAAPGFMSRVAERML